MITDVFRLDGRVAWITGGTSGLGLASARSLSELGAQCLLLARDAERGARAAEELRSRGGLAEFHALDVSDPAACAAVLPRLLAAKGAPSIVIHAAGTLIREDIPASNQESIASVIGPSVDGAFNVLRSALAPMEAARSGSVILTSSYLAIRGGAGMMPVYSAAKAALLGLMKSLAVRYGPAGVRVNAILPAFIETPLNRGMITGAPDPEAKRRELAERFPLRRIGRVEDFAQAAAFLASDLSSWITGHALVLDGGLTA